VVLPPGPALPRAAQAYMMVRHADRFGSLCRRRYGPVFTVRALPWGDVVVVAEPEPIKTVFTGDPDLWRAGEGYELLRPLLGAHSVIVLDGDEHMRARRRLLPPFHGKAIRCHEQMIERVTADYVARWPLERPFAVLDQMKLITLDVLLRSVLGVHDEQRRAELGAAIVKGVALKPVSLLMWVWPTLQGVGPWRRFRASLAYARRRILEEIANARRDPRLGERDDVLALLIQAGELSDGELLDQVGTLLLAGHDTTATALAWTLERLVRHPQALERARDDDAYLDAAIKEAMRVRPVLPAVVRRLSRATRLGDWQLPAGMTVMASARLVQMSPAIFPRPLQFRPERFLEGEGSTYSWIPFGGGTRRCLGAAFASFHMRVVLRTVLRQIELHADRMVSERLRSDHITLMPARGARVVRARRSAGSCRRPEWSVSV
jgi:cytochrome P450 family 135